MTHEIDIAQAELLGEGVRELGAALGEERLAETHARDARVLERRVQLGVRDPALLYEDRAEHRPGLVLEVLVVEAEGRGRAGGDP